MTYVILLSEVAGMVKEKLKPEHKTVLAEYGLSDLSVDGLSLLQYKKNEYMLRQGYACDFVLFVLSGRMKVFITSPNGKTLLFCFYSTRGILGEAEFATGAGLAAMSVQTITDATCIGIPRDRYEAVLKQNITFMNAVSDALAHKLFRCTRNSAVTILYSLESRLCAYIAMTNDKGCFSEKLTEVSEILGTSYRHLLRTLDSLCAQGILQKGVKCYHISDLAAMKLKGEDYYLE
jgi:CRP/FNR family transcriptional regulator, putaive post-exponential-phase nitrogen-starvation regulator